MTGEDLISFSNSILTITGNYERNENITGHNIE
jgi:hypothetical protein